jgi:signal recognition particle GTPase
VRAEQTQQVGFKNFDKIFMLRIYGFRTPISQSLSQILKLILQKLQGEKCSKDVAREKIASTVANILTPKDMDHGVTEEIAHDVVDRAIKPDIDDIDELLENVTDKYINQEQTADTNSKERHQSRRAEFC